VGSDGKLGVNLSARRFKENIQSMGDASTVLLSLKPVTFRYKPELDEHGAPQFGLVAEDVNDVSPDLVLRDAKGEIYSVRYEAVNAMLLNEFLKEHRRVDAEVKTNVEQAKTIAAQAQAIAEQQEQIRVLASSLAEVTRRIETMAQRPEEKKAPAVRKILHRAPVAD
jgi:uncharacterized coiled-coil protein SlyX